MRALRDWRMWAEDRIHLTTEGHGRVAQAALTALGHRTDLADWTTPAPPADRATRGDELVATRRGRARTPGRGCSAGCTASRPATR